MLYHVADYTGNNLLPDMNIVNEYERGTVLHLPTLLGCLRALPERAILIVMKGIIMMISIGPWN